MDLGDAIYDIPLGKLCPARLAIETPGHQESSA